MKASAWSVPRAQTLPWLPEKPIGANKKIKDYTPAEIIQQITREQVTAIIMALTPQQLAEMITRLQAIYIVQAVPIDQLWSVLTEQQKQQAAIQVIGDNLLTPVQITGWGPSENIIPITNFTQTTGTTSVTIPARYTLAVFYNSSDELLEHIILWNYTSSSKTTTISAGLYCILEVPFASPPRIYTADGQTLLILKDLQNTDGNATNIFLYKKFFTINFT